MKFLFILAQLGATVVRDKARSKMHFADCAALAAVLFTTFWDFVLLLRLGLFLNFEQKIRLVFL